MKRLVPGKIVELDCPDGGRVGCRVVATAGEWALLTLTEPSAGLPQWLDRDVYLSFHHGVDPVMLRGKAEPGRRPGELRFAARPGAGHPEPRTAPRVALTASAAVVTATGELLEADVVDLGAGGIRLRHPGCFVTGDRARIVLELRDELRIDAEAVVRHAEPGLSVLVFVQFHSGSTQAVGEWCVDELRRRAAAAKVAQPAARGYAAAA